MKSVVIRDAFSGLFQAKYGYSLFVYCCFIKFVSAHTEVVFKQWRNQTGAKAREGHCHITAALFASVVYELAIYSMFQRNILNL